MRSARPVFFLRVPPPDCEGRAKHVNVSRRRMNSFHLLRPVGAGQIDSRAREVVRGHGLKHRGLLFPHIELRNGDGVSVAVGELPFECHQTVRLRIGEWLKKHGIHHREYRGVRANPQSERYDRSRRKPRAPPQRPRRVLHVGRRILQYVSAVHPASWHSWESHRNGCLSYANRSRLVPARLLEYGNWARGGVQFPPKSPWRLLPPKARITNATSRWNPFSPLASGFTRLPFARLWSVCKPTKHPARFTSSSSPSSPLDLSNCAALLTPSPCCRPRIAPVAFGPSAQATPRRAWLSPQKFWVRAAT